MILTVTMNPALDRTIIVDSLKIGSNNRVKDIDFDPGGKGINVSRVVQRLGEETLALGFVGGENGELIKILLKKESVETDFVEIGNPTRENVSILDLKGRMDTNFLQKGGRVLEKELKELEKKILSLIPRVSIVVLAGSVPPGISAHVYKGLISLIREEDPSLKIILDTSGTALIEGLKAKPFMIKPNHIEVMEILGLKISDEKNFVEALLSFSRMGIEMPIISMGSQGAIGMYKGEVLKSIPPRVKRLSTVGSGDSMVAGLAIALLKYSKEDALRKGLSLGTACGAATAMTPGTDLCLKEDVERLVNKVKIKKL